MLVFVIFFYMFWKLLFIKAPPFQVVLDSDDPLFGGFSRISHDAEYFTSVSAFTQWFSTKFRPNKKKDNTNLLSTRYAQDGWYDKRPQSFMIYTPSRTAVVYALVEDEVVPVEEWSYGNEMSNTISIRNCTDYSDSMDCWAILVQCGTCGGAVARYGVPRTYEVVEGRRSIKVTS